MRNKIIFSITVSILAILGSVGIISYLNVTSGIQRSLDNRLLLATIISKHVDHILAGNLKRLYDISTSGKIDFGDRDWEPEKAALKIAYDYSIFTDRIFLLDKHGNVLLTYPYREDTKVNLLSIPYVSRIISEKKPLISDVYTIEPLRKKVLFALVPLKNNEGDVIGVAGGEINPTNHTFMEILDSIPAGKNTFIELIDSHGLIIASNDRKRIFTSSDHNEFLSNLIQNRTARVGTCHRCHIEDETMGDKTRDMLAFAPLSVAPWGVSIREPEAIVFAPSTSLKRGFLIFTGISLLTALLLGIGLSRGIIRPVRLLIKATQRIGEGNLTDPVEVQSRDEIGTLAKSFDAMRIRLADSLEKIQRHNIELEHSVMQRTEEIRLSQRKVKRLLGKVITSQEEERKRIGRELHDDILQQISVILMKIDLCSMFPGNGSSEKAEEIRRIVEKSIASMHAIINNLRPSVLDDLGLPAAIKWLIEAHLEGSGKNCFLKIEKEVLERRFESQVEITLFRVLQESIINCARHANAENVFVTLTTNGDEIIATVEDDGLGFDLNSVLGHVTENGRGLGILGMKERVSLVDGELRICSSPGNGTRIDVKIPLQTFAG